ncbi:pantoate--beta-alanine ligase, partial [bacterium]|nr:pantoate--beta-alanine ligase [bacterium]
YQQLQVIRRFTRDIDLPVRIEGVATGREADGLALSSRNAYLTPEQRADAPELNAALREAAAGLQSGAAPAAVLAAARARMSAAGFTPVDYVELRDAETLEPLTALSRPARLLAAA